MRGNGKREQLQENKKQKTKVTESSLK
jgi:hypothetical protein